MAVCEPAPQLRGYEHLGHLGSGGFSEVYLYLQQGLRRKVAVKILNSDVSTAVRKAFDAEAILMATMSSHPATVQIFDAAITEDDRPYLVMEYCPPPHLGKRLRWRSFSLVRALQTGIQIAGAVETSHRLGIIHRDIKPSNILVTRYNKPVLTDFGIAASEEENAVSQGISVPWAPPEQQVGKKSVGPSGDIFSLAATIYAMLAGHSPFIVPGKNNTAVTVSRRVFKGDIPSLDRTDVPLALERVLSTAMAKSISSRYSSILEFARALQQVELKMGIPITAIDVLGQSSVEPIILQYAVSDKTGTV